MTTERPKATDMDKLLAQARQDVDVLAVLLFGSVARGEQTAGSDIDVCFVLMPQSTPYERAFLSHKRLE